MCPPQGLAIANAIKTGFTAIKTGLTAVKTGYQLGKAGATLARGVGTAMKVAHTVGKGAQAIGTVGKVASGLSAVAGLGLTAKQLMTKNPSSTSRAATTLSQSAVADTQAKTASTIKPNSASDLRKALGSLRIPLSGNSKSNDTTGLNAATSLLGLNLGG
jgi:hypothetical protein